MTTVDLIDNDENVTGVLDKKTAHEKSLLHRVSVVYAINTHDELIIQIRPDTGLYDHSVGGHVDTGETYEQAVYREANEELLLEQPLTYFTTIHSAGRHPHRIAIYECHLAEDWHFTPTHEVPQIETMTVTKVCQLMESNPELFMQGFRNTMQEYCKLKS